MKNFGLTRNGKVVFYDHDGIDNLTDCNFRKVPQAREEEEEMSGEVWYRFGPRNVFPETFEPFLPGHPAVREVFLEHRAGLLGPTSWPAHKKCILAGHVHDVLPQRDKRFARRQARQLAGARVQHA